VDTADGVVENVDGAMERVFGATVWGRKEAKTPQTKTQDKNREKYT
jgi:hypothetical protein